MINVDLDQWLAVGIHDVNGTTNTRIEAMDGTEDFHWLCRIGQPMTLECSFIGAGYAVSITRARIPLACHDALILIH
jgi:hypothetical protein